MPSLHDYLDIDQVMASRQWAALQARSRPAAGKRQVTFLPMETLLCLLASFVVDHSAFGGANSDRAPAPVTELAGLFRRTPSSVLIKMANLDGTWRNGAVNDLRVGNELRADPALAASLYRTILAAARAAAIGSDELPDFLGIEAGGQFALLGQEELARVDFESALEPEMEAWLRDRHDLTEADTEQLVVSTARIGQHRFATGVLGNCGRQCVFCGLSLHGGRAAHLLVASHIKPWRESTGPERLDVRNGLAACPTHDVAFDTGLLTVAADLSIIVSPYVVAEIAALDHPGRHVFAQPPMRTRIEFRASALPPGERYLHWHRERVFAA